MLFMPAKKQHLDKFLLVLGFFIVFGFTLMSLTRCKAAGNATVTATVTMQDIQVSVTDGAVAYGTIPANSSVGTFGIDQQTAHNDGNVAEDLTIHGTNSANWTLDTTNVTQNHYIHRYCTATCGTAPTNYTALTTNEQTLVNNLGLSGTQTFELYITTPQSSTVYTSQSVNVVVTATAH